MSAEVPDRRYQLAVAATLAAGLAPHALRIFRYPTGADAAKLVIDGSLSNPDWWRWVFLERHWIAYRPLFVGSFPLTDLFGGQVWMHNLANLLIYAGFLATIPLAWRALAPDRPRWGVLALALVCLHPSATWTVQSWASRSYAMSAGFGLASVAVLLGGRTTNRAATAGLLLAGSVLSNEVGYLFAVLGPLALWVRDEREELIPRATAYLAWVPVLFALRYRILGGLGGYTTTQVTDPATRATEIAQGAHHGNALLAALEFTVAPSLTAGGGRLLPLGLAAAAIVACLLAVSALWRPRSAAGWGLAWVLGSLALAALTHTWFSRMGLSIGVGLAFVTANAAAAAIHDHRGLARWAGLAIVATLAANWFLNSPYVRRIQSQPSAYRMHELRLAEVRHELQRPATIFLLQREESHLAVAAMPRWLNLRFALPGENYVAIAGGVERPAEAFRPISRSVDLRYAYPTGEAARHSRNAELALDDLPTQDSHAYLFWVDEDGGHLIDLEP